MKKIISLMLSFICLSSAIVTHAETPLEETIKIYVSETMGDDSYDGTIERPLKTAEAAKNKVREILKEEKKIEVIFRGGAYRILSPLDFTEKDSGVSAEKNVVWKAYDGEEVYFKGSVPLDISKAQEVTDPEILDRLYDDIEDRIFVLDLEEQGIDKTMLFKTDKLNGIYAADERNDLEPNAIYFNGDEQMVASWPNDREYDVYTAVSDNTIKVDDDNVQRWGKAKDAWMFIFYDYDFAAARMSIKSVDTEEKTVTVLDDNALKILGIYSRRWRIYNLMEEIDIPGEYYVDYDNLKLYFFPPTPITSATLEMSLTSTHLLTGLNAKNITFQNINFTHSRGSAVRMNNIDNVDFLGCTFKDIGADAIYIGGTERVITGGSTWQGAITYKHGSYNVDIISCDFDNIGKQAIDISGGDIDTLKPANDIIEDCYITRACQKGFQDAVSLRGCGVVIRNCLMSNIPKQHLYVSGNNFLTEYNEFHDGLRDDDDAGAIYCGRNNLYRGWVIQYNYIHDCSSIQPDDMVYNSTLGIYFDDSHEGQTANNNIIRNVLIGFNSNNSGSTTFKNNTIVDAERPLNLVGHAIRDEKTITKVPLYDNREDCLADIYDKELFFKAYPNLEKVLMTGINPKILSEYTGNFMANCGRASIAAQDQKWSTIENNVYAEGKDMFVNPEKQDFRLKAESEYAKNNPELLNEDNFDIENIGLKRKNLVFNEETAPFSLYYPTNMQKGVQANNVRFTWEKAKTAVKYRLQVATDAEFENIVLDEIVANSTKTVDNLEKNTVYYWRVFAINNSRQFSNEWESREKVHVFSTAIYEDVDLEGLKKTLNKANAQVDGLIEGNIAGGYKVGTKLKINSYLNVLNYLVNKVPQAFTTNAKVERYDNLINSLFTNKSNLNGGFLDIGNYLKKDIWYGDCEIVEDKSISVDQTWAGTTALSLTTGDVVYCFDMTLDLKAGKYTLIGQNKTPSQATFTEANIGYALCFIDNTIELQRTDGSTHTIPVVVENMPIGDGSKHSYKYGKVDLGFVNVVYLEIDGEPVMIYPDLKDPEITSSGEFLLQSYFPTNKITVEPSENVPGQEEFEKLRFTLGKTAAKAIRDDYGEIFTNIRVLNPDSSRLLAAEGVKEISGRPYLGEGTDAYVTVDTIEKLFGVNATVAGGMMSVSVDGKTVTTAIKETDGLDYVSIQEVCNGLGKTYYSDFTYSKNLIVADAGGENLQNIGNKLQRTAGMLNFMNDYPGFEF